MTYKIFHIFQKIAKISKPEERFEKDEDFGMNPPQLDEEEVVIRREADASVNSCILKNSVNSLYY